MGRFTSFTIALLATAAFSSHPALAAPATSTPASNAPIQVQKITWVQPTVPLKVAAPVDPAPTSVRQQGTKAAHPATPKAAVQPEPVSITTTEPSQAAPLHPEQQPLTKVVASYYGMSEDIVKRAFTYYGPCDDALVALFMANASNAKLAQIISLRHENSWKDVINFLQLDTKYLFKNIQLGPVPKENLRNCMSYVQFMNWREDPDFRDLGDLSVRELVGASLLQNRFHVGPLEALRQVHTSGGALAALSQYTQIK